MASQDRRALQRSGGAGGNHHGKQGAGASSDVTWQKWDHQSESPSLALEDEEEGTAAQRASVLRGVADSSRVERR